MKLCHLETPALVLDLDIAEANMRAMRSLLASTSIALRPHYKSHKCPYLAHWQIQQGAKGITCAKLSEAEDLIFSGIADVLIANQITQPSKISRAAFLADCCRLTVCVDRADNIAALEAAAALQGSTIHCLIEYEVGMQRCGVRTPEAFYALAAQIDACPHLVFEGIQAYAGQLAHEKDYEARKIASQAVEHRLRTLKAYVESRGLAVKEVSGTSTGTAQFRGGDSVYTEVQAGSYLFMDSTYGALNLTFSHSLFVLTQVMSLNDDWVIVDGGRKSVSLDQKAPFLKDYPHVPLRVSEEHAAAPRHECPVDMGARLLLVPGHCCTTFNLHDYVYLTRGDTIVDRVPVTSRGKSV